MLIGQKVKHHSKISHEIIWTNVWRAEMIPAGSSRRWHPGTWDLKLGQAVKGELERKGCHSVINILGQGCGN